MLEGLFDVSGWGAVWVGLAAWLAISACWISALVTLNYGPRRFPGFGRQRLPAPEEFRAFPGLALALALAPVTVVAGVLAVSASKTAVALGACFGALAYAATWLPLRSVRRPLLAAGHSLRRLLALDPAGYRDPSSGHLLSGHLFAAQFAAIFVSLYALVGLAKYYALTGGAGSVRASALLPPSLAYVLLLIGLLALIFSGLAFFFDRYRVPVLLPWLALLSVTSLVPTSDHLVETVALSARPSLATPESVLRGSATPILVCASGGGIQAAAWTAAVLTGLERESPARFSSSLRLFSGASGGSVGGLHFIAAYSPEGRLVAGDASLDRIFAAAARSSLDAAAWGLVGPDLLRATVPFAGRLLGPIGRGWALEQTWDPGRRLRLPLSQWSRKPAVIFNATEVESGSGLALGNVDLEPALRGFQHRLKRQANYVDLAPVAAARLSASFPYVTPTPRASHRTAHFADGGYYDNYGVGAAVALLEAAYHASPHAATLPRRVLLIEIRATRSSAAGINPPPPASPILFQWLAPLSTILNVRDAAQRQRNDTTLDLLTRALAAQGVRLERVVFEAPREDVPLSWHLTSSQIEAVRRDWRERFAGSAESAAVARFLAQQ